MTTCNRPQRRLVAMPNIYGVQSRLNIGQWLNVIPPPKRQVPGYPFANEKEKMIDVTSLIVESFPLVVG